MREFLWLVSGIVLAGGFILAARRQLNYEREKFVYGIGLVIAALIYVGFGLFSGSVEWRVIELGGVLIYAALAVLGIRRSAWFLGIGWASHVMWDLVLHDSSTTFVPRWYQFLCLGFDLFLAAYIGVREWKTKKYSRA